MPGCQQKGHYLGQLVLLSHSAPPFPPIMQSPLYACTTLDTALAELATGDYQRRMTHQPIVVGTPALPGVL